jgi:hypothetical protein
MFFSLRFAFTTLARPSLPQPFALTPPESAFSRLWLSRTSESNNRRADVAATSNLGRVKPNECKNEGFFSAEGLHFQFCRRCSLLIALLA